MISIYDSYDFDDFHDNFDFHDFHDTYDCHGYHVSIFFFHNVRVLIGTMIFMI